MGQARPGGSPASGPSYSCLAISNEMRGKPRWGKRNMTKAPASPHICVLSPRLRETQWEALNLAADQAVISHSPGTRLKLTPRRRKSELVQTQQRRVWLINNRSGTSLVGHWIKLRTPNAGGPGSIPGQGTRSHTHAATKSSHAATKEPACRN